jgi:hypothetical protein
MFNMGNMNNKVMDKFFKKVDGVVWDIMTGRVGVKSTDGITTIDGTGDNAQIVVNMFEDFGMEVPAFAQSTPVEAVNLGDLIYGDRKPMGWVVDITKTPEKVDAAGTVTAPKAIRFTIMRPDGTRTEWRPAKLTMLGFESGVMVLRSLMNMLPGGANGLAQVQNMIPMMAMMGGGNMDLGSVMPYMLFAQMGGVAGTPDPNAPNTMMQMMPQIMMMQMMQQMMGNKNGGSGRANSGNGGFFGNN